MRSGHSSGWKSSYVDGGIDTLAMVSSCNMELPSKKLPEHLVVSVADKRSPLSMSELCCESINCAHPVASLSRCTSEPASFIAPLPGHVSAAGSSLAPQFFARASNACNFG